MSARNVNAVKPADAAAFQRRAAADPAWFMREVLGATTMYDRQIEMAESVRDFAQTSVVGCNSAGKDWAIGRIVAWWQSSHYHAKTIITGPTFRQVADIVWREVRLAYHGARVPLGGRMLPADSRWESSDDHFALGFSTDRPYNITGHHCLTPDHEVLTRRGFVPIAEINTDDRVLSLYTKTSSARWKEVTATQHYDVANEPINVYEDRQISFACTDEHRFLTKSKPGRRGWSLKPFSELPERFMVRRLALWKAEATWRKRGVRLPKIFTDLGFDAIRTAQFLGWWLTEGSIHRHTGPEIDKREKRFYQVEIWQVKERGREQLRQVLAGLPYQEYGDHFAISNRALATWLRLNCGQYQHERRIPRFLLDADPVVLDALLAAMVAGDGTTDGVENHGDTYYTSSPSLRDGVQEIGVKLGRPATWSESRPDSAHYVSSSGITSTRTSWVVSIPRTVQDHLVQRKNVRRETYTGTVHCLTTPYSNFLVRRNGKVFWSGNSPNLLVVVTEAHGFSDEHMTMVKRLLPNRLILTGNPFADSGEFFDSHHDKRHLYNAITITAADSPNVKAGYEKVPGLVTQADMDKGAADWGRDSALYRATFDAEFGLSPDGLLPLAWLMAAKARPAAEDDGVSTVTAGIDVAGPGEDETSLWLRQGPNLLYHQEWVDAEPEGKVIAVLNPYRGRLTVNVDSAGIGHYFGVHLKDAGFKVNPINVGESPRDSEQYHNLKAELYWGLRLRFQAGDVAGLTDSLALAQLASIRYTHNARGQVVIESKEAARKRGVKSPDRAEAIMLAFAPPPSPAVSLVEDRTPSFGRDRAAAGERAGQQRGGFWGGERNGRFGRG